MPLDASCRRLPAARLSIALAALFALLGLLAPPLHAGPAVGLVTMEPGEAYWARFGHNALLVDHGDGREPIFYNFGYFDFAQPGFLARFLRGDMRYLAVALPMSSDLGSYAAEGRGARLQWLRLEPEQAELLVAALAEHVRPENAEYRYDYFVSNCSTKVRDALDAALGGALKRQLDGRSMGITYRHEALRHGAGIPWLHLGMHLGLGPYADRPLSIWEQSFIPSRLAEALREVRTPAGEPLVMAERELLPHRGPVTPADPPRWLWLALALGVALALPLARAARSRHGGALLFSVWGFTGLIGLGLLLLWLGTAHESAWANRNLLLFNPLALLLLPSCLRLWRQRRSPRNSRLRFGAHAIAILGVAGVVLAQVQVYPQQQLEWIALLLPLQIALSLALLQARRGA
ncbi:DUF4105 domain-containing protein [Aquimonas voraii]|uniref:Uncharacterized protein n=1 Tax=Aquimonas voraii TaxID=265719 RepID=A0A1G6RSU7_9GAMM|nr:DUF4105 domain-containing protein [Aquimonas voraii]SDD07712.1 protein of unknown function [Aquimonas voraii]